MENNTQSHLKPAVAIVIVIAVIAFAGILFYKNMIRGFIYPENTQSDYDDTNNKLSTSTDLASIERDLNASTEVDISLIEELDENLLDFDELEDFNFDFESTS